MGIIGFNDFLGDEEVKAVKKHIFAGKFVFDSSGVGNQQSQIRTSETYQCVNSDCTDTHDIVPTIRARVADVARVPVENLEQLEALRYAKSQFYRSHHDNKIWPYETSIRAAGARVFSIFIYLTDVAEGGETNFPELGLQWKAKRGSALLFVNTADSDPEETDSRTYHESVAVRKGSKKGLNLWIRQYNYWDIRGIENDAECDSFWEGLWAAGHRTAAVEERPIFTMTNKLGRDVRLSWIAPPSGDERTIGVVGHGTNISLSSVAGHVLALRIEKSGKLLKKYTVKGGQPQQIVTLKVKEGKKRIVRLAVQLAYVPSLLSAHLWPWQKMPRHYRC